MTDTTRRPVADIARDVAAHLPDGWQTVETPHDHGARIVGPNGERIYLRRESYGVGAGRLSWSGGVPDGASYSEGDTRGVDTGSATTAGDRDPAAVARDLTRRLLPAVIAAHHEISGRVAQRVAHGNARRRLADDLAARMGGRVVDGHGRRETYADSPDSWRRVAGGRYTYASMTPDYDADTTAVEIRGLSADHARELADLIATWVARDVAGA